ncbi:MAG: hypothetical protein ABI743_02195 [bacterium]
MRLAPALLLTAVFILGCSGSPSAPAMDRPDADLESDRAAAFDPIPCGSVTILSAGLNANRSQSKVIASAFISGGVATYSWNFGGGAIPNTSSQAAPAIELGAPATYQGSLTVTNGCGTPTTRAFSYTVRQPTFNVVSTAAPPVPNPPVFIEGTVAQLNSQQLVSASRAAANTDLRFVVSSSVEAIPGMWNTFHNMNPAGVSAHDPQIIVVNGNIKVVYYDAINADLRLAQAAIPLPTTAGQWSNSTIDSFGSVGAHPSVAVDNGYLVVSYYDNNNHNCKVRAANNSFPFSEAEWSDKWLPALAGEDGLYSRVACWNGRILVAYPATGNALCFAWTNSAGVPAWTTHSVDGANAAYAPIAMALNATGVPTLAYRSSTEALRVARGIVNTPSTAADWSIHTAIDSMPVTFVHGLTFQEGKPCVSYLSGVSFSAREYVAQGLVTAPWSRLNWFASPAGGWTDTWSLTSSMITIPRAGTDDLGILFTNEDGQQWGVSWLQ